MAKPKRYFPTDDMANVIDFIPPCNALKLPQEARSVSSKGKTVVPGGYDVGSSSYSANGVSGAQVMRRILKVVLAE